VARRRELTRTYRAKLADLDRVLVPYADWAVERSSCYVMPILLRDAERRDAVRARMRDRDGVQTSVFYPAVHEFAAYRERFGAPRLPRTEHVARAEITLPLFPEMEEATQDRVVGALAEALA
jgi:dTDP-4-amino-4,6-dideoxygalactose transaminase